MIPKLISLLFYRCEYTDRDRRIETRERYFPRFFPWLLVFAVISCVFSTWFIVDKEQNAVIKRFGAHVRTESPGIHGKLPWPIESAHKVTVTKVERMEIGFKTTDPGPPAVYQAIPEEGEMLTGDINIVDLELVAQYRVSDPAAWLFTVREPIKYLRYLAQSGGRIVVGRSTFDHVATTGRRETQAEGESELRDLSDDIPFGPSIVAFQLQDVEPPDTVRAAYKDVKSAEEDKDRLIREAEGYQNGQIPEARGQAQQLIQASEGYRGERIAYARGDSAQFMAVLTEYRKAPEINEARMRMETAEKIFPGREQVVVRDEGVLKLLNLTGTEGGAR